MFPSLYRGRAVSVPFFVNGEQYWYVVSLGNLKVPSKSEMKKCGKRGNANTSTTLTAPYPRRSETNGTTNDESIYDSHLILLILSVC